MNRFGTWMYKFLVHHRPARIGVVLLAFIIIVALIGPLVVAYGPTQASAPNLPASADHLFGTDPQGYDLFARMVYGARTTLMIALAATVLSMIAGTLIGAIAGFVGGWTDTILMRAVDFAMSFPTFLLAIVAVAILGQNLENLIIAVGIVGAPMFARQVRAEIIRVVALEYIVAAQALGFTRMRGLFRHALPNSMSPIIVLSTLGVGSSILSVAGLNFLGLGGDPYRVAEWGLILKQGWEEVNAGTAQVTMAGLAIFITVLGFNLFGDGLRDELDPRTRRR